MNALADKLHKQEVPHNIHSDMHSISLATLFNNNLYIHVSSSKLSANWHATATYVHVGMIVVLCGHVMESLSLCGTSCLCTLSASVLIH